MTDSRDGQVATARRELAGFLASRRARITPAEAGLPAGPRRRVAGLRREEVALLAQISVEYYSRLERGNVGTVSEPVLEGLDRVLRLDEVERAHLRALVRAAAGSRSSAGRASGSDTLSEVRSGVLSVLDLLEPGAAFVRNARLDVLAANRPATGLYALVLEPPAGAPWKRPNLAASLFLDPRSQVLYRDWGGLADHAVGTLRTESVRSPGDDELGDLLALLREESPEFRARWEAHAVSRYRTGRQDFHDEQVGDLALAYEALDVVAEPGQTIVVYHAEPGSPCEDALRRLAARVPGPWPAGRTVTAPGDDTPGR